MGKRDIPHHVKEWRELRGHSQESLAEAIGMGKTAISKIENMATNPPLSTLVLIAKALKIPVGELFYPPPSDARTQLQQTIRELNESDLAMVARVVDTLPLRQHRKRA